MAAGGMAWHDASERNELSVSAYDPPTTYGAVAEVFIQELPQDDPDSRWAGIDLTVEQVRELRDYLTTLLTPRGITHSPAS